MKKLFFSLSLAFVAIFITACSNNNDAPNISATNKNNSASSLNETYSESTTAPTVQNLIQNTLGRDETSANDHSVKRIDLLQREYTLANSKKVYGQNFKVTSTLTDENSINIIAALLDGIEYSNTQAENWPKYNPARANEYAIKIVLNDGSIAIINLHFTEQSNICYIAIANCKEDVEYNSFVMSDNADKLFTKLSIEKKQGFQLISLFK